MKTVIYILSFMFSVIFLFLVFNYSMKQNYQMATYFIGLYLISINLMNEQNPKP